MKKKKQIQARRHRQSLLLQLKLRHKRPPHIDTSHQRKMSQLKPVEWAVFNGNLNTLKFFIEEQHYDAKQKGYEGKTLLHLACAGGHLDIVKYLMSTNLTLHLKMIIKELLFMGLATMAK